MELGINVKPYEGRYRIVLQDDWTTIDWGWVKEFSGYLMTTLDTGLLGGDAELTCAMAVIALHHARKIEEHEASDVYKRLAAVPFTQAFMIYVTDEDTVEDDASPPAGTSSNGSESISGDASRLSSESSEVTPRVSGTPGLGSSVFDPPTSVT